MSPRPTRSVDHSWRKQLWTAVGCAAFGVLVHRAGPVVSLQVLRNTGIIKVATVYS